MLKKLLKSALVMVIALGVGAGATGAYFTSTVTASNNLISAGTLRVAIDSTRTHVTASTWNGGVGSFGAPFDSYVVVYDNNGATTQLNTLEPWLNAAPGPAVAYSNTAGADVLPDGNHSYWISFRNIGTIPMKVRGNVNGGTWVVNPAVEAANPSVCTSANLNAANAVTVTNVTFYGTTGMTNICKGHEECENIYYGLTGLGGWTYSTDSTIAGADINVTPTSPTVYASADGTNGGGLGSEVALNQNQFIIARVDANFDTSNNCFQGATYTYNLTGSAYQLGDMTW